MPPAERLPVDERRAQIIEAVTPAVLEHGAAITSRQLAEAAGVAEGTLFKAFGDKESLLSSLAFHHLDATDWAAEQGALTFGSLEDMVTTTVSMLAERMRFVFRLVVALGPVGHKAAQSRQQEMEDANRRLAERFEPFRDELRLTPLAAADVLRTLAWAAASGFTESEPIISVDDAVQVLLHGIVATHPAGQPASITQKA